MSESGEVTRDKREREKGYILQMGVGVATS